MFRNVKIVARTFLKNKKLLMPVAPSKPLVDLSLVVNMRSIHSQELAMRINNLPNQMSATADDHNHVPALSRASGRLKSSYATFRKPLMSSQRLFEPCQQEFQLPRS